MIMYFDIDGVLNRCPQLGGRPFHIEPDCLKNFFDVLDLCTDIPLELRCISLHRNYPSSMEELKRHFLLVKFNLAKRGVYKRNAITAELALSNQAHLIIDDQPAEYDYDRGHCVYAINGRCGLTQSDTHNIHRLIRVLHHQ